MFEFLRFNVRALVSVLYLRIASRKRLTWVPEQEDPRGLCEFESAPRRSPYSLPRLKAKSS